MAITLIITMVTIAALILLYEWNDKRIRVKRRNLLQRDVLIAREKELDEKIDEHVRITQRMLESMDLQKSRPGYKRYLYGCCKRVNKHPKRMSEDFQKRFDAIILEAEKLKANAAANFCRDYWEKAHLSRPFGIRRWP